MNIYHYIIEINVSLSVGDLLTFRKPETVYSQFTFTTNFFKFSEKIHFILVVDMQNSKEI